MAGRAHLPADCFLTVNVNPACLASPQVDAVFADEPHLRGLVIELTEQARIESYAEVAGHLARHRERGALVAIDDAGSGYAGLAHILELRPSLIKLDRSLITGIDRDETKRALVEMLGAFAGRIDAWVLAEGIETVAELETLRDLRVPLGQGYVLGRPAAPWAGVDGVAADVLRKPDAIDEGTGATIRLLVESGPSVQKGEHEGLASRILGMEPDTYVVVVDPHHSPVAALTARGPLPGRLAPVLRVSVTTPIAEAARRALTRTAERRFEPLVCTDAAGRFLGVVRIERVIDWLAAPPRPDRAGVLAPGRRRGETAPLATGAGSTTPTVVFFHAHPDDEAIFTGGTMRLLADRGVRVVLVVATRGELGEVSDDDSPLAHRRETETRAAADVLGVTALHFLGYHDSGIDPGSAGGHPGAKPFATASVDEAADRLAAVLAAEHADALVTYDEHGIYGHPDHVQVHDVGVTAAGRAGVGCRYDSTVDREYLHFVETHLVVEAGQALSLPEGATGGLGLAATTVGMPSIFIDCTVDVRAVVGAKRAAMLAHASQIPPTSSAVRLSDADFAGVYGYEWYLRHGPPGPLDVLARP